MEDKTCTKCGETKSVTEFYTRKSGRRNFKLISTSHCKLCFGIYSKSRTPEVYRKSNLKKNYGISLEDFDRMFMEQEGKCAICGTDSPGRGHPYFNVDHSHSTGEVRGLLCSNCNTGIGLLKDDYLTVQKAADYLLDRDSVVV